MCPLSELIRRVHRVLVLLVVCAHSSGVFLEGVRGHALVDFFLFGDLDFAGELDVVVLLFVLADCL
jgi:hypothetical protein